jgi:D-alanine-D-alanine ligase
MNVVVLHTPVGKEASRDEADTEVQRESVLDALAALGHEAAALPFSLNLEETAGRLRTLAPDVVFNLFEPLAGEGRLIHLAPSLLDHLRLPYTGNPTEALFLTSNKLLGKRLLAHAGIATPPWRMPREAAPPEPLTPGRWIVKSVWEHASIGLDDDAVFTAQGDGDVDHALGARGDGPGGGWFAEAYIDGREFNLSLLCGARGPEVLPPAEIRFDGFPPGKVRIVGYRAKWEQDAFEYRYTPRSFDFSDEDAPLLDRLKGLARRCWDLFNLKGYARVDFRVDAAGRPWILEVNANPGIAPDSGFVAAAERAGIAYPAVIERLLHDAFAGPTPTV